MTKLIRYNLLNNSYVLSNLNTKIFILSLQFSIFFKELFYHKNIFITEINLNVNCNIINLSLHLFFRKKKLIKFRSKKLKKKKFNVKFNNKILFFLSKYLHKKFRTNSISFNFKIINKLIIFNFFYKSLKKKIKIYKTSLFDRRFGLYIDFLKLSVLYQTSKINLNIYVYVLGEIFRRLTKKKHGKFLFFIKQLFQFIIYKYNFNIFFNRIVGMKFIISGKIKGKLRARATSIQIGSIPINTQNKNIEFSQTHIYTVYGVYGIKLWIHKKIKIKENLVNTFADIKVLSKLKKKKNI